MPFPGAVTGAPVDGSAALKAGSPRTAPRPSSVIRAILRLSMVFPELSVMAANDLLFSSSLIFRVLLFHL